MGHAADGGETVKQLSVASCQSGLNATNSTANENQNRQQKPANGQLTTNNQQLFLRYSQPQLIGLRFILRSQQSLQSSVFGRR